MTLGELKEMLSTELAESSTEFFSEKERLWALNLALGEVVRYLGAPTKTYEVALSDDKALEIALPSDFQKLISIQHKDTEGNLVASYQSLAELYWRGGGYYYELKSSTSPPKLRLKGDRGTAIIEYLPRVSLPSDDNEEILPELKHLEAPLAQAIACFAAYKLLQKDANPMFQQQYMNYIALMKELRSSLGKPVIEYDIPLGLRW